jgi:hypothetical protein
MTAEGGLARLSHPAVPGLAHRALAQPQHPVVARMGLKQA